MNQQTNVPFLKFHVDPEEVKNLKLVKAIEVNPPEPEYIYLFQNEATNKYFCVLEYYNSGGPSTSENEILKFAGNDFKDIQEVPPKHGDWFQTHFLYRVY